MLFSHRTVDAAARSRGRALDDQRISTFFPYDVNKANALFQTLRASYSVDIKPRVWENTKNVLQFAIILQGKLMVLTNPQVYVASGSTRIMLGNLSDELGKPTPVHLPVDDFYAHVVSLSKKSIAVRFGIPHSEQDVDDIPAPEEEQGTLERLHFGVTGDDASELPCFAVWPRCCPIPYGVTLPVGHPLNDPLPEPISDPGIAAWYEAMKYAHVMNEGHSVTEGGPLFNQESIIVDAQLDCETRTICTDIAVNLTMVIPETEEWLIVHGDDTDLADYIWCERGGQGSTRIMSAHTETTTENGASLAQTMAEAIEKMGRQLVTAHAADSSEDRERKDVAMMNEIKTKIMFARVSKDPGTGVKQVILPETKDSAQSLFGKVKSASTCQRKFQELVMTEVQKCQDKSNWQDKLVSLEQVQLNQALCDGIRTFSHCTAITPYAMENQVSLANFLALPTDSAWFKDLQNEDNERQKSFIIQSDDAKKNIVKTSLSLGGLLATCEHVVSAIVNERAAMMGFIDYDHSLYGHYQMERAELLMSHKGQTWWKRCLHMPEVAVSVLCDSIRVRAAFAEVALVSDNVNQVNAGEALSHRVFERAINVATVLNNNLKLAMDIDDPMDFKYQQPVFSLFHRPNAGQRKRDRNEPMVHTSNKPSKPNNHNNANDAKPNSGATTSGMLVIKPGAAVSKGPPDISIRDKPTPKSKSEERLCMHFMVQGFACRFNRSCKKVHCRTVSQLTTPEKQKAFIKIIKDSSIYEFAHGHEPSGNS